MIMEIRTYRLKPGTVDDFVATMAGPAAELLARFGITVVDCGRSLVPDDGLTDAYLIRAFESLEERDRLEEAFYSSEEWHNGPRADIWAPIESYHTVVLEVPATAVEALLKD